MSPGMLRFIYTPVTIIPALWEARGAHREFQASLSQKNWELMSWAHGSSGRESA
jgi:hypothetical protein